MTLWIDVKYANILSVQLEHYTVKNQNPYLSNFRCPLCGDSQKSKKKARGYFYTKTSSLFYRCHNCNAGTTLGNIIKTVNASLYNDYKLERYKEGFDVGNAAKPHSKIEFQNFTPQFEEKSPLDRLFEKVDTLNDSNIFAKYLKNRKIPRSKWGSIYYTYETHKLIELCPEYSSIVEFDEPRIIFPFYTKDKRLIGVTARDVSSKSNLRYLTLRIDKVEPMIYNIENIDTSKQIYCTEGPIDSLFLDNAVAVGSSDLGRIRSLLPKSNTTLIFDNQPRNVSIGSIMRRVMEDGWSMVIWPDTVKEKDINEMALNMSIDQIKELINKNSHSGLKARFKINAWSKC
tara:strand:- start:428 stop:1459 length:1032 start_codon:yes stop_codon:yes gene_type:complete